MPESATNVETEVPEHQDLDSQASLRPLQDKAVERVDSTKRKHQETAVVPARRCRKKQHVDMVQIRKRVRRGCGGKGNRKAKGKSNVASIADKEAICKAYGEARESGAKAPAKKVEHMRGYYHGCIYESKWMKVRREQSWTLLVAAAPKLTRRHKELPDSLRAMLKLPSKFSERRNKDGSLASLPVPLQQCVASLITDRIDLGQEVDIEYVKGTVSPFVEIWNSCVETIRGNISEYSMEFLRSKDELSKMSTAELTEVMEDFRKSLEDTLLPVSLKERMHYWVPWIEVGKGVCGLPLSLQGAQHRTCRPLPIEN